MANEKVIREIVGTYKLSEKLGEKMVRIAKYWIEEKMLTSFDEQYRYISELVEKFQFPFKELRALRLDHSVLEDSDTAFHSLIGYDDPNLAKVFEDEDKAGITIYEAVDILRGQIDKSDFDLMMQLLYREDNNEIIFHASPDQIMSNSPQIQERLEALIKKYEKDGRLVIPRRPILYVKFDPAFLIKFRNRRYNGNPLAFFEEHSDVYKGMSRRELYVFDSGLYYSLISHKQMNEAIPEKRKKNPYRGYESPLDYFLAHHEVYNGLSRNELNKFDQRLYNTLKRHRQLDKAIPEKNVRKYRGYESPLNYFLAHPETYGNMSRKQLVNLDQGLYQSLRTSRQLDQAIPERYKRKYRGYESPLDYFLAHMDVYKGMRRTDLRNFDSALYITLLKYKQLEQAIPEKYGTTPESREEIIAAHTIYRGNASEASRCLPYARDTIVSHWKAAGLKSLGRKNRYVIQKQVNN